MGHCANCDALRERVARLEREVGQRHRDGEIVAIMDALNVSMSTAIIVSMLYVAGGEPVAQERLIERANIANNVVLRTLIVRARVSLGQRAIKCEYRMGYFMTPEGRAAFRAATQPTARAA